MRSAVLWAGLALCLLAVLFAAYGIVGIAVKEMYATGARGWDSEARQLYLVLGTAVVGASVSAWALVRRRRAMRP